MGRLTDSLKKASSKLDDIELGVNQMASLSEELAKNTATVADASLKLGYAYAKAEEKVTPDPPASEQASEDISSEIAKLSQKLAELQSSQNSLKTWNDLYRLQQALVVQYLQEQDLEPELIEQIQQIFKVKGIKSAPTLANKILKLTPSKILRLLTKQLKYRAHLLSD